MNAPTTTTNQTQRPTTKQLPTVPAMLRYEDGGWWLVFRGTCPSPDCHSGHVVVVGADAPESPIRRNCLGFDYEVNIVGIEAYGEEPGPWEAVRTIDLVRGR